MARRKKSTPVDDLLELVALMPWWAGVLLALVSYLLLHRIALQPVPVATQPAQIGAVVTQSMWKALAMFGQYVVPLACLLGAGTSAVRRRERRNLVADVAQRSASDALDSMSWR